MKLLQPKKKKSYHSSYIKNHPDEYYQKRWVSKEGATLIDKVAQLENTTKKDALQMMIVMAAELYARSEINFEKLKRAGAELNEKRIQAENAAALSFIQRMRQKVSGRKEVEPKSKDDQPQSSKKRSEENTEDVQ